MGAAATFGERTSVRLAFIAGLVVLLLLAQAAALALTPTGQSAQTGRVLGRAGFAYLSGIRTFAAAVLWNRLEPQFHLYYEQKGLSQQTQMLPVIRLVQTLDPQFVQAYYVASWVVSRHGDLAEGFRISREGIANNPRSGLLRASYIQNMLLQDNQRVADGKGRIHLEEAVKQADAAMQPDTIWNDDAERFEGYAAMAAAYDLAGLDEKRAAAQAVVDSIRASAPADSLGDAGHDHDGDGKPDH